MEAKTANESRSDLSLALDLGTSLIELRTPSTPLFDKPLPPMPREYDDASMFASGRKEAERASWLEIGSDSEDVVDLEYLRGNPPAAAPPSPWSLNRPRAPTPLASVPPVDDLWATRADRHFSPVQPSNIHASDPHVNSLDPRPDAVAFSHSPLLRSASEGEASLFTESAATAHSFARPPKPMILPDPSQYPDPYPFRPPHQHLTSLPALSSAGSSSASTRSSAYTSSGSALASGDYGHVQVATGEDEGNVGVGITSDDVVQFLVSDGAASPSARGVQSRLPIDQTRWSESYSVRSRSSSVGNNNSSNGHENPAPKLQQKPSYDMGWQTVDERDEVGMSEEETDEEHILGDDDDDEHEVEEERTSAIVMAEEGRGLIVEGAGRPVVQLNVQAGTTHLLIGSSSTPNAMPSFLTNALPQISATLLALDISANFLGALPPSLASCHCLEELNIASNPLRVLPAFLSELVSLRVLIADSTGISTLPDSLAGLDKLHTLSIRRNKLHALPSWLCLLSSLQTLYVDGNPFQGPWKALVEPLMAKIPTTPMYPPSTPMFPLPSASIMSNETDGTDIDDASDPASSSPRGTFPPTPEDEEHTITPERSPFFDRSAAVPNIGATATPASEQRGLTRTRTAPNRAFQSRTKSSAPETTTSGRLAFSKAAEDPGYFGDHELRKMKSAGELRKRFGQNLGALPPESPMSPARPGLTHYPTSVSSSNLLQVSDERPTMPKRFASLGPASTASASPARYPGARPGLPQALWDDISEGEDDPSPDRSSNRVSFADSSGSPPSKYSNREFTDGSRRPGKDGKDKSRWGFLKKMSMGKIKVDTPTRPPQATRSRSQTSTGVTPSPSAPERLHNPTPQIDMRFSSPGFETLLPPQGSGPTLAISPPALSRDPSKDELKIPSSSSASNLLAPPSPSTRTSKRRSFLPIDAPASLNIPIPEPSRFVPGLMATNDEDDAEDQKRLAPTPTIDNEQYLRREEERAREAYMRALRSVMAYLKDMNDLGLSQQSNSMTVYGSSTDEALATRSRRPTVVDAGREVSVALSGMTVDASGQLRSSDSIAALRSGTSSQTMSVATTDSNGSAEERKFKDDKGKRAMVVREIVETERTYVKGLQELVDIYVKPGNAPVNIMTGVGSSKDTVVPSHERKIVFNGVDALFSFHKDSFLPALEIAAAPIMKSSKELQTADADGQLSFTVAKAVGNMFLKHAAFMKMYSSYINNFDNSVQRIKFWTADRSLGITSSPASTISPSSSTAQLVGLGLSMSAISSPGVLPEGPAATGVPHLSTSQRKRLKTYLKRCRMNPRHSQLNLEGYLLLPVQRIPRYRLLLEELLRSTPPTFEYMDDPLDRALTEISSLANNMNEGKRESESRRKLVQWQARIRGRFPSPLVQPHRRLIMDGPLLLTRVVRKAIVSFEAINAQGDASTVQVDCLAPELTPRPLIGILCNDLLVLCRDPSEGKDPVCAVDLWAVLRMQTLPQPASIVHGNALRLVDNKAILYFDVPSPSDALNWFRAINLHIPASKS